jgi:hypothetical protein
VLGRQSSDAGLTWAGLRARGRNRPTTWMVHGPKEKERERKKRWAGCGKERKERGEEFSFFKFLFKFIFQTFKLQTNRNPCIRIMMRKHLLFLNYFNDV